MPDIMPIAGGIILAVCTGLLLLPLFLWRFTYRAADSPVTLYIPKAGRYTLYVKRRRFWKAYGDKLHIIFSIAIFDARDEKYFISAHRMKSPVRISAGFDIIKAGYFNAPYPGKFTIVNLPECNFAENDKIIIRRYTNKYIKFIPILGILISPHMITSGLLGGLISLGGALVGAVLVGIYS